LSNKNKSFLSRTGTKSSVVAGLGLINNSFFVKGLLRSITDRQRGPFGERLKPRSVEATEKRGYFFATFIYGRAGCCNVVAPEKSSDEAFLRARFAGSTGPTGVGVHLISVHQGSRGRFLVGSTPTPLREIQARRVFGAVNNCGAVRQSCP